jgi:hypothetical protein
VLATKADLKAEITSVRAEIREFDLRMTIKLAALIMAATGIIHAAIKSVK